MSATRKTLAWRTNSAGLGQGVDLVVAEAGLSQHLAGVLARQRRWPANARGRCREPHRRRDQLERSRIRMLRLRQLRNDVVDPGSPGCRDAVFEAELQPLCRCPC